jgi:hypothetical protein
MFLARCVTYARARSTSANNIGQTNDDQPERAKLHRYTVDALEAGAREAPHVSEQNRNGTEIINSVLKTVLTRSGF